MKHTRTIAVVTLTTAALALSACGRGGETASGGATAQGISDGKANGTITVWAMGAEGEKLPALAKEFETANPGVKVEVTGIPWDSAHDKFTTAITASKTPDAAMVGTTWMGEFAGLGALDPTPASIDKSAFFEGAQKTTEVGGKSFGIPWYVETRLVYYRTTQDSGNGGRRRGARGFRGAVSAGLRRQNAGVGRGLGNLLGELERGMGRDDRS